MVDISYGRHDDDNDGTGIGEAWLIYTCSSAAKGLSRSWGLELDHLLSQSTLISAQGRTPTLS